MKTKIIDFFERLKYYFRSPEMRSFWLILFLMFVVLAVDFIFLRSGGGWLMIIVFLVVLLMVFINNARLADVHQENKIKTEQLQDIVENLKDGLIAYNLDFKIQIFNKAAEEIFGILAQEAVGKIMNPNLARNPQYRFLTQTIFPSLSSICRRLSEPDVWPQIVDLTFEDKTVLRVITGRVTGLNGQLLGFFKIVQNRTREKELLQSKNEFITVAAHQLRTPLTGIGWAFETLSKEIDLKPEQKQIVGEGYRHSQRLLKTVNDLLDVAKIEEGKFGYQLEEVNLEEFLKEILISAESLAKEYKIKLYFEPATEIVSVKIDPQRINLVLFNLLDNAIRYNIENGEVVVRFEKLPDRAFVRITVKDTGIGIPAEEVKKLFTKFYRGSNVLKFQTAGSGLGLYIAKNIVQRHGGEIGAESSLGRGSVFYFTLPTDYSLIPTTEKFYEEE